MRRCLVQLALLTLLATFLPVHLSHAKQGFWFGPGPDYWRVNHTPGRAGFIFESVERLRRHLYRRRRWRCFGRRCRRRAVKEKGVIITLQGPKAGQEFSANLSGVRITLE